VKEKVEKSKAWKKPIVTHLEQFGEFWLAEDYHQKYLEQKPDGYTCHFERKLDF
jgi:peptide methionine sulfoxide reductase MsrA